jgi:hypothetical protein
MAGKRKRPKLREKDHCIVTDIYKPDSRRTTISFGSIGERSEGEIYTAFGQWLDLFNQPRNQTTIGNAAPIWRSIFAASYPSISGICMSIKTASNG